MNISGIAYSLGEHSYSYEELPKFHEKVNAFGMPNDAALWGWGQYRRTLRDPVELAIESACLTLNQTNIDSTEVDVVILCAAASIPSNIASPASFQRQLLGELNLENKPFFALTLNQCATLLMGLKLASTLVSSEKFLNILVLGLDAISSEEMRFDRFAIFSDAASSCLISREMKFGYEISNSIWLGELVTNIDLPDIGIDLASKMTQMLKIPDGVKSISKVFHDNLFIPIVTMREQMAGFLPQQLFHSNISRIGHCFTSDPLINLVDFTSNTTTNSKSLFLLACSVPGIRVGLLLNKIEGEDI